MEIKHLLFLLSFIVTVFLFVSIAFLGSFMDGAREDDLDGQFERMTQDFNNMRILSMISESYGDDMACLAFETKLRELDTYIWDLGEKIDKYRIATEEFNQDKYYVKQKKLFNENELYYFLLLRSMVEKCNITKTNILFFYKDSKSCDKCDDESFVLRDIKYLDTNSDKEVAVFSFDMDLGLSSLELLEKYYKIEEFPCMIIDGEKHCGMKSKEYVMNEICDNNTKDLNICNNYFGN